MPKTQFISFLHPKYWPTWTGLILLRLVNLMPFHFQLSVGRFIGAALYWLVPSRRHVVSVNLTLCFPELKEHEREKMVKQVFTENGIGIIETAMAWWSPRVSFQKRVHLEGSEYLDEALAEGKGVILLGAHFSTLDLGGLLFSLYFPLHTMYRPHNNPVMNRIITRGRLRSIASLVDRSNFRQVIKLLKHNKIVWYAPDQDFGPKHSIFAPFFGINAATVTATAKLAKISGSPVIMLTHHRTKKGQYVLRAHPRIAPFPLENDAASAERINEELEKGIRYQPSQYMWVHRRFKTQPNLQKNMIYNSNYTPTARDADE